MMRKVLSILLMLVMIPVFSGICCPCAHAAQDYSQPLGIERVPCHGCCANSSQMDRDCGEILTDERVAALKSASLSDGLVDFTVAESDSLVPLNRIGSPGLTESFQTNLLFREQNPLYLQIQVLRF